MTTYFLIAEILLWVAGLLLVRHSWYRFRFFLHICQLSGYHLNEYRDWCYERWNSHIVKPVYLLLIILLAIDLADGWVSRYAMAIIAFIFVLFWFTGVGQYRQKAKKPLVFTPRMTRQALVGGLLYIIIPGVSVFHSYYTAFSMPDVFLFMFSLLTADLFIPLFVGMAGTITRPYETFVQNRFKKQARDKIASLPNLKVIAITGSYGKTTTKFVLKTLLSERFNICFTPGSYNTPMGICKVINNDLEPQHQILVLEMGARYAGNIDELCDIAPPDIAIVTNVGVAHLETFGNRETIAQEKGTLVRRLNRGGTAVLNADDPLVMDMQKQRDDVLFLTAGLSGGNFTAEDIEYGRDGCSFTVNTGNGESARVQTPLLGSHNIHNILLAMAAGSALGLRLQTMAVASTRIDPVKHRLELKHQNGITVIDDAFNSNPVGAANAVEVLGSFREGRRIIITPGMVELGEMENEENRKFGRKIAENEIDLVILVGQKRTEPIRQGLLDLDFPQERVKITKSLYEAREVLAKFEKPGDVVLYENDLPDSYNE